MNSLFQKLDLCSCNQNSTNFAFWSNLVKNVIKKRGSNVTLTEQIWPKEVKIPTKSIFALWSFIVVLIGSIVLTACGAKPVTLDVDMTEYKFTPDDFTVPAGVEITINHKSSGKQHHQFQVLVLGAKADEKVDQNGKATEYWSADVVPNGNEALSFTAPSETGEYIIKCALPGHTQAGMVATLHVK